MPTWHLAIVTHALSDDPQYYAVDRELVLRHAGPTIYRVKIPPSAFG